MQKCCGPQQPRYSESIGFAEIGLLVQRRVTHLKATGSIPRASPEIPAAFAGLETPLKRDHYRRSLLQASHQLELERSFSASILNNTAEGILVVGSEGQIRFANPAITHMLGCSGHELENTPMLDWIETPREDNWQTSIWFEHWQQCRSVDAGSRFGDVRGQASRQGAVSYP